ncbi:MAG: DUF4886 domain-containing protein [Lentisphaerae bacterium]|nr:DUF4886 domain-containing protein [Lentisphaerota bacterium]
MGKSLNVLMIGNSFSICVGKFLPQMVRCFPGNKLKLTSCYIGGCSLETHWNNFVEAGKNPDFKPYRITVWDSSTLRKPEFPGNVNALLKSGKYDVVTIQQASRYSVDYVTYQPYADKLISQIKKYQPQAEIIIQQTWSYRADAPFLRENDIGNGEMYSRLEKAYDQLAKDYGFRMIPTGYAVQISRKLSEKKFENYDWAMLDTLQWPDLPRQAGDVVGNFRWRKNDDGEMVIYRDTNHLNMRGEYLQAAVWCGFLYGIDPEKITYVAPKIGKTDAAFLRKCAKEALVTFKQIKE